jgi:superoxide reductase
MEFPEILKGAEAEGKEKHVPFIEVIKGQGAGGADSVHVLVGKETPHPNTVEHHIVWIELFGVKQDGQVITLGRADFAPSYSEPDVSFTLPVDRFKALAALSYCNIHGLWQNIVEI